LKSGGGNLENIHSSKFYFIVNANKESEDIEKNEGQGLQGSLNAHKVKLLSISIHKYHKNGSHFLFSKIL